MKRGTLILGIVAFLGGSGWITPLAAADRGFYIGGAFGTSEYRSACDSYLEGSTALCEERGNAWKVLAGFQIDRHWGIEASWVDLGTTSFHFPGPGIGLSGQLTERGTTLVGTWTLPVTRPLAFFARAGLLAWRTSAEYDFGFGRGARSDNGLSQVAGVGMRLRLGEALALRLEVERYFGGAKTFAAASRLGDETTDVDFASIGLTLGF